MLSVKLTGTITAEAPIMITRPEQGDGPLQMTVVRNQMTVRTHVLPGETIKGLLRGLAFRNCVNAARYAGEKIQVDLPTFYTQTAGGLSFTAENRELGADEKIRLQQPLLSLFGSATPRLKGTLYVGHAIAQPLSSGDGDGLDMPPGMRLDTLVVMPDMASLLSDTDKVAWSRQNETVTKHSEANKVVADAKRALGRARGTKGVDTAPYVAELERAQAAVAAIREAPDFRHSVQRPIPVKHAAPAGTVYEHEMAVDHATPEEVGLLLAALDALNQMPRIGGGRTTGYGNIRAEYAITVLSGTGLPRDRRWEAAGTVSIGRQNQVCVSDHIAINGAIAAWRAMEARILETTNIFG